MKRLSFTLVGAAGLVLAGCGGSSDYGGGQAPTPVPTQTNFTSFVSTQVSAPATETAVPADVENTTFAFTDDDNPVAFDALIAAAP